MQNARSKLLLCIEHLGMGRLTFFANFGIKPCSCGLIRLPVFNLTEARTTGPQNPMHNVRCKPPLCIDILQVNRLTMFKDLGLKWVPSYSFLLHVKYGVQVDKNQGGSWLLSRSRVGNSSKFLLLRCICALEILRYALILRGAKWTNTLENSPFLNYLLLDGVKMSSRFQMTLCRIFKIKVSNYFKN